jgi:hypothetical protein
LIDDTFVEDIFKAVTASQDAPEMAEINGGDDDVDDTDFDPRPTPRHCFYPAEGYVVDE